MTRNKVDMSKKVFIKALRLVQRCVMHHGQVELNLCGIGESTMHPDFIEYLGITRSFLPNINLVLASNGVKVKEEYIKAMAKYRVQYYVSMHRPEVAGPAIELGKKYGVLTGVSADPAIASIDWAGQVDWHVSTSNNMPCPWLTDSMVMVTAEGDLVTCCLDGDGVSKIGTVDDNISKLTPVPYSLCKSCHHTVPMRASA